MIDWLLGRKSRKALVERITRLEGQLSHEQTQRTCAELRLKTALQVLRSERRKSAKVWAAIVGLYEQPRQEARH